MAKSWVFQLLNKEQSTIKQYALAVIAELAQVITNYPKKYSENQFSDYSASSDVSNEYLLGMSCRDN